MFTSILVATDGSIHSERAVAIGCDLAAKYQAKLILVHVIGHGPLPKGLERWAEVEHLTQHAVHEDPQVANVSGNLHVADGVGVTEGYEFKLHELVGERIIRRAKDVAHEQNLSNVKEYVDIGSAVDCILQWAGVEHADIIVMGTRGMSEIEGLLMGSVSHKICQLADIPVLTVK